MTVTELGMRREDPPGRARLTGPSTDLDELIVAALTARAGLRLSEITNQVEHPLPAVHSRLRVLVSRNVVLRDRNPEVSNGPGASTYRLADDVQTQDS